MLEPFFFALGLVNNVLLILIFLVRKNHLDLLQRIGWSYFLLAIPAVPGASEIRLGSCAHQRQGIYNEAEHDRTSNSEHSP